MRVLYCNPVFAAYRIPFYMELNKLFHNNLFVLYSSNRYENDIRFQKLKKDIPILMGEHAIPFEHEIFYYTKLLCFSFTKGLIKKIAKIKPSILITEGFGQWTPLILLYAIITKTPLFVSYERTIHTERNNPWFKTLHRKITNKFITAYLVNGSECQKYLFSIGVNQKKIFIGGMNADSKGLKEKIIKISQNEKIDIKSKLGITTPGHNFLFTGMIIERKGLIYLLKVWEEHLLNFPHDNLIIVGTGDKLQEYKKQFLHPSIHFVGRIEYDQIAQYYSIADVYIIPTLEDNWSLVVPEAMACGLPIACSKYNGCHPELVDQENGCVFDPLQPDSILQCLSYFHGKDLKKMGEHSIMKEIPFNAENSAKRVYTAIMNNHKKR